ncbi:YqhV family protein [Aquibacillus sediminis]|uniref:YqhV family protein n=1 Tax=Aquibacillus sediminis TaxID=2574734 RepID=UPI001109D867|nr:YqhV family protein [Aquibacillus sediminis]
MFSIFGKTILVMALFRLLSGSFEIIAALLILKYNDIEKALIINSSLAFVGPLILIITTAIGLAGMSDSISFKKLLFIFAGVALIIYAVKN